MPDAPRNIVKTGGSGDVAFAIVVSFSYLAMITASFESLTSTTVVGLMVIGTLYTLNGIYGYAFVARHSSSYLFWAYFPVQILLSGLIVTLGRGAGFNALLMLPLAGQAVVLLPPRGVYATSIGILVAYIGAVDLYSGGLATLWNNLITFLAGLVFVVVFTQLNMEQEKRAAKLNAWPLNWKKPTAGCVNMLFRQKSWPRPVSATAWRVRSMTASAITSRRSLCKSRQPKPPWKATGRGRSMPSIRPKK